MMNLLWKMWEILLQFVRIPIIMILYPFKEERRMGEVITVLSGKGGTGKTSLCAGIASAVSESGARVLCIDCDVGLRNLDIALGLGGADALSFLDVCDGGYPLSRALRHPAFENLRFLTAPVGCSVGKIHADRLTGMLTKARGKFEYIFLDAPAGVDAGFRLAAQNADRVLLVTGAERAAMRDAEHTGELLALMGKDNVRLIVNRVDRRMFRETGMTVDDVMDETGLPLIGIVPEDRNVPLAAALGKPLLYATNRGAAAACRRIARRIGGKYVPVTI